MNKTNHYDLTLVSPEFDSKLTGIILRINSFAQQEMIGTTPRLVFSQLKNFFHNLESVSSARIEGNNTTILDYMESKDDEESEKNESILEIDNINECLEFIDNEQKAILINRMFISDMHKQVVKDLTREGSKNPGEYRKQNISISGSEHTPQTLLE